MTDNDIIRLARANSITIQRRNHPRRNSLAPRAGIIVAIMILIIIASLSYCVRPARADVGHPERRAVWTCVRMYSPSTHICRIAGKRVYCHCYWRRVS